ncbi:MAG TPA: serine hydrolase domain-containing protein [Tepidisphaeraceae bacterium]|nr:serine hydrolase domain-containing protein [Tepidisphaeraceae bacterium]
MAPAKSSPLPRRLDRYDFAALSQRMQQLIDDHTANGFGLMIVKDGQIVYEKAFGQFKLDDVVPIASATKMPTVTAVMRLVDQKKIDLNEKVSKYLPEWPADKTDMTIRQLLSCTHGLPQAVLVLLNRRITLEDATKTIAQMPLRSKPGEQFAYGGAGFQVAGRVAEVVSGKPWNQFFQEELAKPLGLTSFTYGLTQNPMLGGGAFSNMEDYAKLLILHLGKGLYNGQRFLNEQVVAEMQKDEIGQKPIAYSPVSHEYHYGLSWWLRPAERGKAVTEFSDPGMLGTTPWIDLERGYGAIILIRHRRGTGLRIHEAARPLIQAAIDKVDGRNAQP